MSTTTPITCHCGNRIQPSEVLQQGRFFRLDSPSFVYIKYRCSHCKRLGERFVREVPWAVPDAPEATDTPMEIQPNEQEKLDSLGAISIDEVVDFHFRIQDISLSDLLRDLK